MRSADRRRKRLVGGKKVAAAPSPAGASPAGGSVASLAVVEGLATLNNNVRALVELGKLVSF